MGSEENRTEEGDGVRLFVGLVVYALDFISTEVGLWECRRRGCSKRDKALLRKKRNTYIRWVRKIVKEVVRNE